MNKEKEFTFSVTLKPLDKPFNLPLPENVDKEVYHEYLCRYLESLGVSPNASTMEEIKKRLARKKVKITAAFKSQGWKADIIQVSKIKKEYKDGVWVAQSDDILASTLKQEDDNYEQIRESQKKAIEAKHGLDLKNSEDQDYLLDDVRVFCLEHFNKANDFMRFRHKNVEKELADETKLQIEWEERKHKKISYEELKRPISAHPKQVIALQRAFIRNFPQNNLRYTKVNMKSIERLFTAIKTIRLVALFCHYAYWTLFGHEYCLSKLSAKDTEAVLLELQKLHMDVDHEFRRHRHYSVFLLPLFLDCISSTCQNLFRHHYPTWFESRMGPLTDTQIIKLVDELFGAERYLQSSSLLQAHATFHDRKRKRKQGKLSDLFHATSRLLKTIFPEPTTHSARRIRRFNKQNPTPNHFPRKPRVSRQDIFKGLTQDPELMEGTLRQQLKHTTKRLQKDSLLTHQSRMQLYSLALRKIRRHHLAAPDSDMAGGYNPHRLGPGIASRQTTRMLHEISEDPSTEDALARHLRDHLHPSADQQARFTARMHAGGSPRGGKSSSRSRLNMRRRMETDSNASTSSLQNPECSSFSSTHKQSTATKNYVL